MTDKITFIERIIVNVVIVLFTATIGVFLPTFSLYRIWSAARFAEEAHGDQRRKYSGVPYILHPLAVAILVARTPNATIEMVIAAVLHDVVEDTDVTSEDVYRIFGPAIGKLVEELTDVSILSDGNRATRRAIDLAHTAKAGPQGQTIKLADISHNAPSILKGAPGFARSKWVPEKVASLDVLLRGDPDLWSLACKRLGQ